MSEGVGLEIDETSLRRADETRVCRFPTHVPVYMSYTGTLMLPVPHAPSFRRPPLSRRGEALWERAEAGSGLLGAASSESAAGSGWLRACGC